MPEIRFQIQWPDGTQEICYSPSLVVKDYFVPNHDYEMGDFVERSRTAYRIANERVQAKYGMQCGMALGQLQRIEEAAIRFNDLSTSKVRVIQFID
ncbi:MAG: MSMEG_0570 family nitrogen starvation response protein [Elainellaceae cyanobacterium]